MNLFNKIVLFFEGDSTEYLLQLFLSLVMILLTIGFVVQMLKSL